MRKILPWLGIAAAAAYFLNQAKQLGQSLRIAVGRISFNAKESQRSLFANLVLDVNLLVNNGSRLTGKITGGNLDFIVNDKKVGSINNVGTMAIQADATTVFPVQVRVNTLSLFPSISELVKRIGSGREIAFTISGSIFTSFGEVVVNQKMNFTL